MDPRRAVAVAGVLALAGVLVVMLLQSGPRRAGTGSTANGAFVITLQGQEQACQGTELLPAGTAALRMTIGTYGKPGPPLEVLAKDASGRLLTSGSLAAGWKQGIVTIPVRRVTNSAQPVTVCVTDRQRSGALIPIALAGNPGAGYAIEVAGHMTPGVRLRYEYMRAGDETWLSMLPTIAHRLTIGRSGLVRHWAWIAFPLLMILAVGVALRVTLLAPAGNGEEGRPS